MTTFAVAVAGSLTTLLLARDARHTDVRARARTLPGGTSATRLPAAVVERLERALAAADLHVAAADAIRLGVLATTAAAIVAGSFAPALAVPAAVAVPLGAAAALHLGRGRAGRRVAAALPELLEHVAAELRSGGSVPLALDAAAEHGGPLGHDLHRIRRRRELGASLTAALVPWVEDRDQPGVREVAGALVVAVDAGGAAADALDALAASLRDRLAVAAEARALATQARLSAGVVAGAPAGYLVWSALVDPRTVGVLVGTPVGRACLGLGGALEVVGALWSRRILRSAT